MAGVYSKQMFSGLFPSTRTTIYTVPAGFVGVVRCMTAGWGDITVGDLGTVTVASAGTSRVWQVAPQADYGSELWNGRLVLNAGDGIRVALTGSGSIWLTISGYELTVF